MRLQFPDIYAPSQPEIPKLLCQVRKSEVHQILSLHFPRHLQDELEGLGLHAGGQVRVLMNDDRGTLLVHLQDRAVILGRQLTYHTRVVMIPTGRVIPFPGGR